MVLAIALLQRLGVLCIFAILIYFPLSKKKISPRGFLAKAARWFRSRTLTGLQELEVTNPQETKRYPLPPLALACVAPSLRVLDLSGCRFRDRIVPPGFPRLKLLRMSDVRISEDSLQRMIAGCAVLESVLLLSVGFGRLCISSGTLKSFNLFARRSEGGGELVIEDAPCLERLLLDCPNNGPATIRVIRAPKLAIFGFYSQAISTLQLGTTVFQKMIAVTLTTKMHTMKILALDSIGANLDAVVDFLKCFPCLEKLYVILHLGKGRNNGSRESKLLNYDPLDPIECLEFHLQKVVLKNYDGNRRPFIDFAKIFVLNAKVLKQIEIGVLCRQSDKWMCDQRRKLQVENRASRDAQIELRNDTYASPLNHEYAHESRADPFE